MLGGGLLGAVIVNVVLATVSGLDLTLSSVVWTFVGQAAGSFAVMGYLSRSKGTGSLVADFGLEIRLAHWWGLPAGAGLQIAAAIVTAPLIRLMFPDGAPEQSVVTITKGTETVLDVILIVTTISLLAPVVEEIIFRGMLLSRFVRSMAVWWAIVAQAAVFAAIHLFDPSAIAVLPGLFLIGAVLGYAAVKSGSLSLPISLHAGVNLTAALLLIYGGDLLTWLEEQAGLEPAESLLRWLF